MYDYNETLEVFSKKVRNNCLGASVTSEAQIVGYFVNGLPYKLKKDLPMS